MDVVEYDYDLSRHNAIADLRGIGWKSIEEQMADLEPTDIPEEVQELELLNPVAFLQSFTHDLSVGHRIPPQSRTPLTFANFTRDLFEPYIVREVTKRFQHEPSPLHLRRLKSQHQGNHCGIPPPPPLLPLDGFCLGQ